MRVLLSLAVLVAVGLATKLDNLDVDEILNNNRLYKNYYNCIMDTGKCTPDGKKVKAKIPDLIKDNCASCDADEKATSEKVVNFMLKNKKTDYEAFEKKYDPTQHFRNTYASK